MEQTNPNRGASDYRHAPPQLNGPQSRNYYEVDSVTSAADLLAKLQADIWRRRAPIIGGYMTGQMHWWREAHQKINGGHSLASYGYYTQNGGGMYVYDTAFNAPKTYELAEAYPSMLSTHLAQPLVW